MKQTVLKYKLVKIGHVLTSVAICALGFAGAASADTISLGTSLGGSALILVVLFMAPVFSPITMDHCLELQPQLLTTTIIKIQPT